MFSRFSQYFSNLGCLMQLVLGGLFGIIGLGLIVLLLQLLGFVNLFGGAPIAVPTASPTVSAPASSAPTTTAPVATTPGQATGTVPPEDNRLVPPEDFAVLSTSDGMHTVSWVWPSGQELDPTFFRVSVQGEPNDFPFTGPGEYQFEVPAACGSNPNFIHLDAFNTEVEPEANSQAEELHEVDPGC